MRQEHVKFFTPDWSGWKLANVPDSQTKKVTHKLVVDDKVINDVMEYGGIVATAREPFVGSIVNLFIRLISGIVPNAELKCAYIVDFGDAGKVDLFVANDVWSSHAIISIKEPEKLDLLVDATKEYIRYRCFVDSIQPQ